MRRSGLTAGVIALVTLMPTLLSAQEEQGAMQVDTSILDDAEYGAGRYADEDRRDPFMPLTGKRQQEMGPRFEDLRLTGVFLGAPGASLAVLEDPSFKGYFLRVGDQIGGARLLELRSQEAVFDVRQYGAARRITLRLEEIEETP